MGCGMLFALRPDMFTWYPKPAPRIANIARVLLIVHGLANMAQGFYSIMNPSGWRTVVPPSFAGTPDAAIQAIGESFSTLILTIEPRPFTGPYTYWKTDRNRARCVGNGMVPIHFRVPEQQGVVCCYDSAAHCVCVCCGEDCGLGCGGV